MTDKHNKIKRSFIEKTLATLGEIPKIKIHENLTEAEAWETEKTLIAAIGRIDLGTGPLTNMSEGGAGGDFGKLVKRAKAKWTPEKRKAVGQKSSAIMKQFWASMTEQERADFKSIFIKAGIEAQKKLRDSDPEYDIKRGKNISNSLAKRTPEQKAAAILKTLTSFPPEERSKIIRQFHATQTPEERSRRVKGSLTPEQLSERSRRAAASRNPEERSAQIRRQQASLTKEQEKRRSERARLAALGNTGRRWINDGKTNRRLKNGDELPIGWIFGQRRRIAASINDQ
jgi:hypothetical protein